MSASSTVSVSASIRFSSAGIVGVESKGAATTVSTLEGGKFGGNEICSGVLKSESESKETGTSDFGKFSVRGAPVQAVRTRAKMRPNEIHKVRINSSIFKISRPVQSGQRRCRPKNPPAIQNRQQAVRKPFPFSKNPSRTMASKAK